MSTALVMSYRPLSEVELRELNEFNILNPIQDPVADYSSEAVLARVAQVERELKRKLNYVIYIPASQQGIQDKFKAIVSQDIALLLPIETELETYRSHTAHRTETVGDVTKHYFFNTWMIFPAK